MHELDKTPEAPLTRPVSDDGTPLWEQINKLFGRAHIALPPIWLRDELVSILQWARYGEAISAYLSTTSAGVTEEQTALDDCPEGLFWFDGTLCFMSEYATVAKDERRQRDAYVVSSGEYFWGGVSTAEERSKLMVQPITNPESALEASRVAPASQKEAGPVVAAKVKPLDLSALLRDAFLAGRGLKDGDRLSDDDHTAWSAYDPERMNAYIRICAALYASPAPAGEPVGIKALEWGETSYGTPEVNTVVGVYRLNRAWSGGWSVNIKSEVLRDGDGRTNFATVEAAKAAAQAHFDAAIRSALHPTPTPVSAPVGVVERKVRFARAFGNDRMEMGRSLPTELYRIGDTILVWANEGDLCFYGQEFARYPAVVEGK